jgi:hypothetical protein
LSMGAALHRALAEGAGADGGRQRRSSLAIGLSRQRKRDTSPLCHLNTNEKAKFASRSRGTSRSFHLPRRPQSLIQWPKSRKFDFFLFAADKPLHGALSARWNPDANRFAMLVISHQKEPVTSPFFWDFRDALTAQEQGPPKSGAGD